MTLYAKLQDVMRNVFMAPTLEIGPETTALDVAGWDSLSHTLLILEMETAFGVHIDPDRVAVCNNIQELVEYIESLRIPKTDDMTRNVLVDSGGRQYRVDLLRSIRFNTLIVEITSRCNLRCIFCPKAIKDNERVPGRDMDMDESTLADTLRFARQAGPAIASLVGVGETTFREDWKTLCQNFFNLGMACIINSNFGRLYTEADLDALLKFANITISIESSDIELQKKLRKAVDLKVILTNIIALRSRARLKGVNPPRLTVNCTVSDLNVLGVKELAAFCAELGIDQLNLSSLYEIDELKDNQIRSIEHLEPAERGEALKVLEEAQQILQGSSTQLCVQPRLLQLYNGASEEGPRDGLTRVCTQPWTTYTVGADGQVFPCCVTAESFARIDEPLETLLNGQAIRKLRGQLLDGDLPTMCQACSNAPLGSRDDLCRAVVSEALRADMLMPT
jgi:acyl carrier protein